MPKNRHTFVPRRMRDESTIVPFTSAEEAWFWFMRCQKLRNEGVKLTTTTDKHHRPCEPDDLYRTAKMLHRKNRLKKEHLSVMTRFGLLECPPDERDYSQKRAAFIWDDAMGCMLAPLRKKGIVVTGLHPVASGGNARES